LTPPSWPSAIELPSLLRASLGVSPDHWHAVRSAVLMATSYVTWLRLFEHWLEPLLRGAVGRAIGRPIIWVRAVGRFRIWGLRDGEGSACQVAIGALGHITVALSAAVPTALLHLACGGRSDGRWLTGSNYLASIIIAPLFVAHLLLGEVETC